MFTRQPMQIEVVARRRVPPAGATARTERICFRRYD
jgi:hypothetical protein